MGLSTSQNPADRAIEAIASQFWRDLASGRERDEAVICAQHSQLAPDLEEALRRNRKVHERWVAAIRTGKAPAARLDSRTTDRDDPLSALEFGDYLLQRPLGCGGFAIVFEAVDSSTGEKVAIKILDPDRALRGEFLVRFQQEAHIARQLDHPNIVPVVKAADHEGRHYLVMRFVIGKDLQRHTRCHPVEPNQAARIAIQIARACAYAHEMGIVHRDIKPENVLIDDETGNTLVTDFGLAKQLNAKECQTSADVRMGTLHYMPPEQADPQLGPISPASDIYAIGACLYFLLTGKPPFPRRGGTSLEQLLHEVQWATPERLPPSVPKFLRTICYICLQKRPIDRYPNANSLAGDLQGFLHGRAPRHRRPGPMRRVHASFQRRPLRTVGLGLLWCALLVVTPAAGYFAMQADTAEQQRQNEATRADTAEGKADESSRRKLLQEYAADMRSADTFVARGDLARARALVERYERPDALIDPRGFEWWYLRSLCEAPSSVQLPSSPNEWSRLTFDSTGERLAAIDTDGVLVVWDADAASEIYRSTDQVSCVTFDSAGKYCITLSKSANSEIWVRDSADFSLINRFGIGQLVRSIAVSDNGTTLLAGNAGTRIHMYELPSGEHVKELTAEYRDNDGLPLPDVRHGDILDMAISPNGKYLATGHGDGTAYVWDIDTNEIVSRGPGTAPGPVTGVAFSPDGVQVATQDIGGFDHRTSFFPLPAVRIWSQETAEIEHVITPHAAAITTDPLTRHNAPTPFGQFRPVFSSDGKRLFTTGPRTARAWNIASDQLINEYIGHRGLVYAISLSPDGNRIAAAGEKGTIHIWPTTGGACSTILSHEAAILNFDINKTGTKLAAVCEFAGLGLGIGARAFHTRFDGELLRIWDLNTSAEIESHPHAYSHINQLQFARNGESLIFGGGRYWLDTSKPPVPVFPQTRRRTVPIPFEVAWISPNESFAVQIGLDTAPTIFELPTFEQRATLGESALDVVAITISPDEKWIVTSDEIHGLRVWSATDGLLSRTIELEGIVARTLNFSHDGSLLVAGMSDHSIRGWSIDDGELLLALHGHRREVTSLAFTPDGTRLASASGDIMLPSQEPGEVLLWDMQTGQRLIELRAGLINVFSCLKFDRSGNRLFGATNALGDVSPGRIVVWTSERSPR